MILCQAGLVGSSTGSTVLPTAMEATLGAELVATPFSATAAFLLASDVEDEYALGGYVVVMVEGRVTRDLGSSDAIKLGDR